MGPRVVSATQTLLGPHSGFQEGQFALHMSSALSPKVSAFGELSMTARADAGTGSPAVTGFNVELERLIIRYDLNDYFKVSFGRYHTPINYWNTAYHHGEWLQTTASRPEMTQFGGSFIPVHFVGMLVEGAVPAGGLNVNYNLGLGNGRGQVISRSGDIGDINNNRAWLVNAFVKPNRLYGLQVGGSVYRDLINPLGGAAAHEWIQSAHIAWLKETPEVIAEFANVSHQPVGGGPAAQQPGVLRADGLSPARRCEVVEALLPLRVHAYPAGRCHLPHSAEFFGLDRGHAVRHFQFRRPQDGIPPLYSPESAIHQRRVPADEFHILGQP